MPCSSQTAPPRRAIHSLVVKCLASEVLPAAFRPALCSTSKKEIRMYTLFAARYRRTGRLLLTLGLGAFLGFGSAGWAKAPVLDDDGAPAEAMGDAGPSFQKALKPVRPTPSEALGVDLAGVPSIRLKAVDTEALLQEESLAERGGRAKGLRYGLDH